MKNAISLFRTKSTIETENVATKSDEVEVLNLSEDEEKVTQIEEKPKKAIFKKSVVKKKPKKKN